MILAASLGSAKAYLDHRLQIEFDNSIKSIEDQLTIEYAEIYTSLLGSIVIDNLSLTIPNYTPLQIDLVTLTKAYQFYDLNKLPQHIQITIKGLQFQLNDTAPPMPVLISALGYAPYYLTPRELRGLGYARLNTNIDLDINSDENRLSLLGIVDAQAWGKLKILTELNNVPAPTKWRNIAKSARLQTFSLNYTNKGLVNQVFTWLAQRNKITINQFKQTLIAKLKNDIQKAQITLDASVLSSIQQFIQNPNQLTIDLQPNPPITINTFLQTSPKRLGLKMNTGK